MIACTCNIDMCVPVAARKNVLFTPIRRRKRRNNTRRYRGSNYRSVIVCYEGACLLSFYYQLICRTRTRYLIQFGFLQLTNPITPILCTKSLNKFNTNWNNCFYISSTIKNMKKDKFFSIIYRNLFIIRPNFIIGNYLLNSINVIIDFPWQNPYLHFRSRFNKIEENKIKCFTLRSSKWKMRYCKMENVQMSS